jgi:hypothetical protein
LGRGVYDFIQFREVETPSEPAVFERRIAALERSNRGRRRRREHRGEIGDVIPAKKRIFGQMVLEGRTSKTVEKHHDDIAVFLFEQTIHDGKRRVPVICAVKLKDRTGQIHEPVSVVGISYRHSNTSL